MATTVAQDEAIRAAQAVLTELCETQERLRARHHALSTILSRRFNNLVTVPPEVTGVSVRDASLGIAEIDRQLAALDRQIDAQHGALQVADAAAQATILESELPKYRRLVDACEWAKAKWDEAEAARQAFLLDLRRRGVFQEPPIAGGARQ
jgi:hypothetical protein